MKLLALSSGLLLTGSLLLPTGVSATPTDGNIQEELVRERAVFPIPTADLVISIGGDATPNLGDVLKAFEDIAHHNLHLSNDTRTALHTIPTGLSRSVTVPAAEVYSYISALLYDSGFVVAETRRAEPRILSIYSLNSHERGLVFSRARTVAIDEVPKYERHPAMLVQTVIEVEHIDGRQLANSLRAIIVDNNVERIMAMDEKNLMLVGTGPRVGDWIRLIRVADKNATPEPNPDPPVEQPGGAQR